MVHIYSFIKFYNSFINTAHLTFFKESSLYSYSFTRRNKLHSFIFSKLKNIHTLKNHHEIFLHLLWENCIFLLLFCLFVCLFAFALGFCLVQNKRNVSFHFLRSTFELWKPQCLLLFPYLTQENLKDLDHHGVIQRLANNGLVFIKWYLKPLFIFLNHLWRVTPLTRALQRM